jgi:hypothetical protein
VDPKSPLNTCSKSYRCSSGTVAGRAARDGAVKLSGAARDGAVKLRGAARNGAGGLLEPKVGRVAKERRLVAGWLLEKMAEGAVSMVF